MATKFPLANFINYIKYRCWMKKEGKHNLKKNTDSQFFLL